MIRVIEKPSPIMVKAIEKLKNGEKIGELVSLPLKNGEIKIINSENCYGLYALDKVVTTPNKVIKTRFIYDIKRLRRWRIDEKHRRGEIRHKITSNPPNSSGQLYFKDRTMYTFSGTINAPKDIRKYGTGQKVSQKEFKEAVDFIRQSSASKAYSKK
ncbi:hypothetical protein J6P92_03935 [bacterium]|nr:hypothetical protein [bacterium]